MYINILVFDSDLQ